VLENVVLTVVSGALGLIAGSWLLDGLTSIGLSQLPRAAEIDMDYTVVRWTMAACVVGGTLIGLVPMGLSSMSRLADVLRSENRSATAGRTARVARHGLIVTQIALAFALLLGSGLLVASFRHLLHVDPGFSSEGVVTASLTLPPATYPDDGAFDRFLTRALAAIRSIPGVTAVGATDSVPFDGSARFTIAVSDGLPPNGPPLAPRLVVVTPGYFEAMRIGLLRGRYLDERDHEGAPRTIVIDERLARRFWPGSDPVGRSLYVPYDPEDLEKMANPDHRAVVVGVVRDVRQFDVAGRLDDLQVGTFYTAYSQPWSESLAPRRTVKLAIRSASGIDAVVRRVRAEMATIDRALPLWDVRTMAERTDLSLTTRRAMTVLTLAFGSTALFLAALGIYGVLTYLVAQRTREVGIRIALGGTVRHIVSLVLREGLVLIASGLAVGFVAAAAARPLIESQLYGVHSLEPGVVAGVVLTLAIAGMVACTLPARRAIRVDPMIVLKQD
jgi:putative ABC transport system permease protein